MAFAIVAGLIITAVQFMAEYWYFFVPGALIVGGLGVWLWSEKARRDAEEAARQLREWLKGPPPVLLVPGRFTDRWFADNVPFLHPGQVPVLMAELRARGWKDDRLALKVQPHLDANPYLAGRV